MKVRLLIFICLLINSGAHTQIPSFLADTLISEEIINSLHPKEKLLLDSMVKVIDAAPTELEKLKAVDYLIEKSMSIKVWPKYNDLVLQLTNMNVSDLEHNNEELIHLRVEALGNKGYYFIQTGSYSQALHQYELAIQLASYIGDTGAIAAAMTNTAGVNQRIGNIEKAIQQYTACIKLYQLTNNEAAAAPAISNLGVIFHNQGEIDKAIEYFNRAYSIAKKQNNLSSMASRIGNIASMMIDKNLLDSARSMYMHALKLNDEAGNETGKATDLNGLGMVHARKGEYRTAIKYVKKSLAIQRQEMAAEGECTSLILISNILSRLKDYKNAFAYSDTAFLLANKIQYLELIMEAAHSRYLLFTKLNRHKKALEMYQLNIKMRDSIRNTETQSATIQLIMRNEYDIKATADSVARAKENEVKDAQFAQQKAEIKTKQHQAIALSICLLLVIGFTGFIYNRYKISQKQKREIESQKEEIEGLHTEVTDSIHYAAHIQNAILTSDAYWQRMLANHFIFFKPRDIVSGDFYWAYETPSQKKIWIAADCTGHGVPGGFMSMLGNTFLNEIIIEQGIEDSSDILNSLREHIIKALASDVGTEEGLEMKDGMDLALCILHPDNTLEFAGANNPLWVLSPTSTRTETPLTPVFHRVIPDERSEDQESHGVREATREQDSNDGSYAVEIPDQAGNDKEGKRAVEQGKTTSENGHYTLTEVKANKQPIGAYTQMTPFTSRIIQLNAGDQIYTFTDGFPDQFGGPKLKKYMSKRLKKFLFSIAAKPMTEQKALLLKEFEDWRKDTEQVDDVCIIGVRI